MWSRRETYTPLERSKRRPVPSELQACAHLRSQPFYAPNCTAPQLPPTSSASHPPCLPSPCTSPLHLTPLGPWRLSRTWRVPRCGGRVPCRGRARCSGRVVRRGREARRGLGSCSPLASARRTTADGRALVLGQQLLRDLRCSYPPIRCSYPPVRCYFLPLPAVSQSTGGPQEKVLVIGVPVHFYRHPLELSLVTQDGAA